MDKDYLKARFPLLMLVFTFGGIFGFIYEEIFYRFDLGEWVKRGTTFGPWIPIYGFGGLIILGLTFKFRKKPLWVFLFATIASGVLELVTGWVCLTFFHVRQRLRLCEIGIVLRHRGRIPAVRGDPCLREARKEDAQKSLAHPLLRAGGNFCA